MAAELDLEAETGEEGQNARAKGIVEGLVRVAVGLEYVADVQADLAAGLALLD